MVKRVEFNHLQVAWDEGGVVSYQGRVCGQFVRTRNTWNNGQDPVLLGLNTCIAYTEKGAAIAEARKYFEGRKS